MSVELPEPIFLWAAVGSRDEVPSRLRVLICPVCAALVAVAVRDVHDRWHATPAGGAR